MPKFPTLARYQQCRRSLSSTRTTTPDSQSPQNPASDETTTSTTSPRNPTQQAPTLVKAETSLSPSIMASHNSSQATCNEKISLLDTAHPSVRHNLEAFLDEKEIGDTYSGFFYNRKHIFILIHDANTHAVIAKGRFEAAKGGQKALDYVLQMPGCKEKDFTIDGPVGKGPRELWAEEAMEIVERESADNGRRKGKVTTSTAQFPQFPARTL